MLINAIDVDEEPSKKRKKTTDNRTTNSQKVNAR